MLPTRSCRKVTFEIHAGSAGWRCGTPRMRVGFEAEECDDQVDKVTGRPCLGNVCSEILDGVCALISSQSAEKLGLAA